MDMESNQVVFSSINYGTDTSAEGRCVMREILKSTYQLLSQVSDMTRRTSVGLLAYMAAIVSPKRAIGTFIFRFSAVSLGGAKHL